ncbi:unnamed protein product [Adineta steineri]|uniref:Uncharacterized protein n=1 Tax=Adineta steineri TaxID=433720 RepID=A0A813TA68_9BILA|nr:unnamed protein product [Adineta steineri]
MARSSSKKVAKKLPLSAKPSMIKDNDIYMIVRDLATDKLILVARKLISSSKKLSKVVVGDIISHGNRGHRIRAKVVLIGSKEQCEQSLQIVEKMGKSSSQFTNNNKSKESQITTKASEKKKKSEESFHDEISGSDHEEDEEEEEEIEKVIEVQEEEEEDVDDESEDDEEAEDENDDDIDNVEGSNNKENVDSRKKEIVRENNAVEEAAFSSPDLINLSNQQSPRLNTESSIATKRKDSPNESNQSSTSNTKRPKNIGFISTKDYLKIVSQLAAANEQNELYQTTWMPRPVDKITIKYFINTGKVLSDDIDDPSHIDNTIDNEILLSTICETLNMTDSELHANIGKSILSTARQVIGAKYPNLATIFADVQKVHIQAITEYCWLMHPLEKKANDASKIRRAMGNVFATRTFSRKIQLGGSKLFQPDDDFETNNDNNNQFTYTEEMNSSDSSDVSDIKQEFYEQEHDEQDLLKDHVENHNASELLFDADDVANEIDIASALILLKKQHHLSTKCIEDIILLLKSLRVSNTPSSWYKVKRLLSKSKPQSTEYFICSICDQLTINKKYCQFCSTTHHVELPSFRVFSVKDQLQNILFNHHDIDLYYRKKDLLTRDIRDASVYQSIRAQHSNLMLTLTINIDGIQPSKGSIKTIWPIILIINELSPDLRFAFHNIILAGLWPGPSKPSRDKMKHLLRPIVDELLLLERGQAFNLLDRGMQTIHVYLIAGCCDKPAQALAQCIVEPIAAFGCGRCEIEGQESLLIFFYLIIIMRITLFSFIIKNKVYLYISINKHKDKLYFKKLS